MKERKMRKGITILAALVTFGLPLTMVASTGQAFKWGSPSPGERQRIGHLLDRTTFGPRPNDIERVSKLGWKRYLDQQLHPEKIDDSKLDEKLRGIESINLGNAELAKFYPPPQVVREILEKKGITQPEPGGEAMPPADGEMNREMGRPNGATQQGRRATEIAAALAEKGYRPGRQVVTELQKAKILRAVYSERQLQEVMTDFWFNHFNVLIQKGADRILTTSYERDVIRPRVFGKFEDLLRATAESPAMLFYLDNWMSSTPDRRVSAGRPVDTLLRRRQGGLNENYAREIMELHTLGVDGGYTQKDVQEVARCFTGWTLRNLRQGAEFTFVPQMHDKGEKVVLGKRIAAGGGKGDGEMVIHLLATHPSTARHISLKLAQRFVSDDPPKSLVDRLTKSFQQSDGDIEKVLRTLFESREFWAPESQRAKIKTPFELTVSAVRALGAETDGGPAFHNWIAQMGEGLFLAQPPTGYPDRADNWVNAGALLTRINFAIALTSNKIRGTRVDWSSFELPAAKGDTSRLVDWMVARLLGGELSLKSRETIDRAISEPQAANDAGGGDDRDLEKIAALIIGSPEFQRQ